MSDFDQFGTWVRYGSAEVVQGLRWDYREIQCKGSPHNFESLHRYNRALHCLISLLLRMWVQY